MKPSSPYLTADEAAAYLRFPNVKKFHDFRYRYPRLLTARRRGRILLFRQDDLDAALQVVDAASGPQLVRRRA